MSSSRIRKAVIPVAGLGTRFLPATKVVPKEMLPVAGRPLIQFAVEEAAAAGLETVILVVNRRKNIIAGYFDRDPQLETVLAQGGKREEERLIRRLSELAKVLTTQQERPLGLADAIRRARPLVGHEPFAVILPDALIDSAIPCILQLMDCHRKHPGCIVATQLVEPCDVSRFGIVDVVPLPGASSHERAMRVTALTERPQIETKTSRYGIFGRYILEPDIFSFIETIQPGFAGELQLTDALQLASGSIPIHAYRFDGVHYDAGSKLGFLQATLAYSLKDPELSGPLRHYLSALELNRIESVS
jgi:UTP--glucose-1-phosphate uridylyltransferase